MLTHSLVCSQNKGLREYQRRHSWLHTCPSPPPEAERQACNSQRQKARGSCNLSPRDGICHQAVSRSLVATHVFPVSWTAQIYQKSGVSQPKTSSSEETHGSPGTMPLQLTWEPKWLLTGRCMLTLGCGNAHVLQPLQVLNTYASGVCSVPPSPEHN